MALIYSGIGRTWPRPLDRTRLHVCTLHLQKAFGRSAQHINAGQVHISHERRRADFAKTQIRGPGIALGSCTKALRQVDLIAIAGVDITLYAFECRSVS